MLFLTSAADTSPPSRSLRQQKPTVLCTLPRNSSGGYVRLEQSLRLSDVNAPSLPMESGSAARLEHLIKLSSFNVVSSPIASGNLPSFEHPPKWSVVSASSPPIAAGSATRLVQPLKLSVVTRPSSTVTALPFLHSRGSSPSPKYSRSAPLSSSSRSFRSAAMSSSREPCIVSRRLPHRASDARQPDAPLRARAAAPSRRRRALFLHAARRADAQISAS